MANFRSSGMLVRLQQTNWLVRLVYRTLKCPVIETANHLIDTSRRLTFTAIFRSWLLRLDICSSSVFDHHITRQRQGNYNYENISTLCIFDDCDCNSPLGGSVCDNG